VKKARYLFESLRPRQWLKNGFILIPLLFAQKISDYSSLLNSLQALATFCILASAIYLINDLKDIEDDRKHPDKKNRPLAAGRISPRLAKVSAGVLILVSMLFGALLGLRFTAVILIYLVIQLLYNYRLKDIVILDIFCVSSGFFLRVIAGGVAIQVSISHWLIICSVLIALFLSLAKRRHELVILGQENAPLHRRVLSEYSPYLLDQMICLIAASTLLSYMLYCISPETIEKFQTTHLIYTFPFVLYGIFRYLYLIHQKGQGGGPEKMLLSDLPLLLSVILWAIFCTLFIYKVI
jgi:4-hydroxybenzoate polyprenyltransferase